MNLCHSATRFFFFFPPLLRSRRRVAICMCKSQKEVHTYPDTEALSESLLIFCASSPGEMPPSLLHCYHSRTNLYNPVSGPTEYVTWIMISSYHRIICCCQKFCLNESSVVLAKIIYKFTLVLSAGIRPPGPAQPQHTSGFVVNRPIVSLEWAWARAIINEAKKFNIWRSHTHAHICTCQTSWICNMACILALLSATICVLIGAATCAPLPVSF